MDNASSVVDFTAFAQRAAAARNVDPRRAAQAGMNLVRGALHIRSQDDAPVTTPAEAIGAWIGSMAKEATAGDFHRSAEMREALISAAEEVEEASKASPEKARLRNALFEDALGAIGGGELRLSPTLPWILSGVLGGILLGLYFARRKR